MVKMAALLTELFSGVVLPLSVSNPIEAHTPTLALTAIVWPSSNASLKSVKQVRRSVCESEHNAAGKPRLTHESAQPPIRDCAA